MAPFPAWSNSLLYGAIALGALGLGLTITLLFVWVRSPYNTGVGENVAQPIIFDHRHHANDDGIDCRYCHYSVETTAYAGVPPVALCMGCHGQIWNDVSLLEPVRTAYFNDTKLAWRRVHSLPDFVFFNHSIHVERGVGCETCHGRVDQMANVHKAEPLTMEWCVECHRSPQARLRPLAAITEMGRLPGPLTTILPPVHPGTTCSACHR